MGVGYGPIWRVGKGTDADMWLGPRADLGRRTVEALAGIADHRFSLIMLTSFELWHRIFVDAPTLRKLEMTLLQAAQDEVA